MQKHLIRNMRYINMILLCGVFVIILGNIDLITGKETNSLQNADAVVQVDNISLSLTQEDEAYGDSMITPEYNISSNTTLESEDSSETILLEEDVRPKVALTFDDGPHPVYTAMLLDGLKERDIKATFFLIGRNIEGNEELVKRMYDEGHLIGNHTYDHVEIRSLSDKAASEQLVKTNSMILNITGDNAEYVRPPFGKWKNGLDCGIPMILVMWTVDPLDWTTTNVSQVVNKVVAKTKENDIILLHDCYKSSVEAALEIVDQLQNDGYDFVTVDELILE